VTYSLFTYPPRLLFRRGRCPWLYPPRPVQRKMIAYHVSINCVYGKFGMSE